MNWPSLVTVLLLHCACASAVLARFDAGSAAYLLTSRIIRSPAALQASFRKRRRHPLSRVVAGYATHVEDLCPGPLQCGLGCIGPSRFDLPLPGRFVGALPVLLRWVLSYRVSLRLPLPDLGPVLSPTGFCCLPVTCSGPPEPAPRAELAACSDRTKAQQRRERPGCVAY
jgi:hypothetical protein